MPPKEAPKKAVFRAIKVKAKSGRGTMDANETFKVIFENGQYASILDQYNDAAEEDQELAKQYFDEIQEDFGEQFFGGQEEAELGWTECDEDARDAITKFMRDHMLPDDE